MTLKTLSLVGSLSIEMEISQVPPPWTALPSNVNAIGWFTGRLFIAEMLYDEGLSGEALQGKSEPSALSGELSRLATLKGTGEDIFMWALATLRRARRTTAMKPKLKRKAMVGMLRWWVSMMVGGMFVGSVSVDGEMLIRLAG